MSPEQINIAIAESLGWRNIWKDDRGNLRGYHRQHDGDGMKRLIQNWTASLDACAEFEKTIKSDRRKWQRYLSALGRLCGMKSIRCDGDDYPDFSVAVDATAPQRCEAYLRTINKWEESVTKTETP